MKRECIRCGQTKTEKSMKSSYCGECASAKARKWELDNRDRVKISVEKRRKIRQEAICVVCDSRYQKLRGESVCSAKCKLINITHTDENECWNYPSPGSRGYGQFSFRGEKNKLAHRISYREFKGEIPTGKCVCHKCDNPRCVNPEHLFVGTHKENVHDGIKKGRIKHLGAKGRNCKFTNLTEVQIYEMRKLYAEGLDYTRLSRIFNCGRDYVGKIIRLKARKPDDYIQS